MYPEKTHIRPKRVFLGKEFTVEAMLKFVSKSDDAMIVRPNDDHYGSDFMNIMSVVDILNEQGFIRLDFVDYDDCSNLGREMGTLDDITTYEDWQPGAEAFKDLNICLALHSFNAYQPYSLADILRMNDFDITVTVKKVMTM